MEKLYVDNYLLDEEQTKAILENAKYSLISAGAGSGKTLTIIGKIKYILQNSLVKPSEICCLSFTNEATNHLKQQIIKNCKCQIEVFTFHKLALNILNKYDKTIKIANPSLLSDCIEEFFFSKCFGNNYLIKIINQYFWIFYPSEKNWQKLIKSSEIISFKETIEQFIKLFQVNYNNPLDFITLIKSHPKQKILIIIYAIFLLYTNEKNSINALDFDDIITKTIKILKEKKISLPYKIIIIDEFQDTSPIRFQFIQELLQITDANLCAVGDDYQSIYHFSGCNIQLFLQFQNYFPTAKIYKLENTYRNSQELINLAGRFIMKNKSQMIKYLKSSKRLEKPIKIIFYHNEQTILFQILKEIDDQKQIFILSRNHFDLKHYINTPYTLTKENQLILPNYPNKKIKFLTIHASKGLECDIAIILNMKNSLHGFPSLQKDQKIFQYLKNPLLYPYEEERRLFYVALTRTKSIVYLLVPQNNPSKFILEIKKEKEIEIQFKK